MFMRSSENSGTDGAYNTSRIDSLFFWMNRLYSLIVNKINSFWKSRHQTLLFSLFMYTNASDLRKIFGLQHVVQSPAGMSDINLKYSAFRLGVAVP